jgi:D-threo-aldose 1-dehydrogenase
MNFVDPLPRIAIETDVDVLMVAGRWTLVDRTAGKLMATCADQGVSVLAAAPFNSGLLAKPWPADGAHFNYELAPSGLLAKARKLASLCERFGTSLPQAAVQFPLQHPAVASVVTGMRTSAQVEGNLDWMRALVAPESWQEAGPFTLTA